MMKKLYLFSALLLTTSSGFSQFFPYPGPLPALIPDNNTIIDFSEIISGLPVQINSSYGLSEVCLDITHPQVSDLRISLTSPDNTTILLSLHNGSGGANFVSTCFQMNASVTIGSSVAPFFGSYLPDQSLNILNNGQDPNGTWTLSIIDAFPTSAGQINSWSLTFSINPPPDPGLSNTCTTNDASGCTCKDSTLTDCDLLPDLICSYIVIRDGWAETPGTVDLPNAVIDIGSGPVEMRPTGNCFCDTVSVPCSTLLCPDGTNPKERVNQRIYHKNTSGQMTFTDSPAGNQSFHPTHNHVHAEDFTEFSLRIPTPDPDPNTWPVIGSATKQGYCMINMGTCNTMDSICMSHGAVITDGMLPNLGLGTVTGCGSQGQGLYVGHYDIYGSGFGQSIPVPNICNGDYYIVTKIDQLNHFREEDETNNIIAVPVYLTQQAGIPLPATFTYAVSGLTAAFFNYTPGVTRTWDFGDGTSAVSVIPSHQYAVAGTYVVRLTVNDSTCASSSAQVIVIGSVGTGVNNSPSGLNTVKIYPNPAREEFKVSWQLVNPSPVKIEAFNILGTLVWQTEMNNVTSGEFETSIAGLSPGSYQLKISANDRSVTRRVIVMK
jgi:subtilisin-like proprotein convertase family protein